MPTTPTEVAVTPRKQPSQPVDLQQFLAERLASEALPQEHEVIKCYYKHCKKMAAMLTWYTSPSARPKKRALCVACVDEHREILDPYNPEDYDLTDKHDAQVWSQQEAVLKVLEESGLVL